MAKCSRGSPPNLAAGLPGSEHRLSTTSRSNGPSRAIPLSLGLFGGGVGGLVASCPCQGTRSKACLYVHM